MVPSGEPIAKVVETEVPILWVSGVSAKNSSAMAGVWISVEDFSMEEVANGDRAVQDRSGPLNQRGRRGGVG